MTSTAFMLAGLAGAVSWRRVFCAWRPPAPFSLKPPSAPRFSARPGRNPNGSINPPGNGDSGGAARTPPDLLQNGNPSDLYAATPELEALLTKPSDAPALAHVVSYNVLSSSLASPSHFKHCDPADLDAHTRLARVLTKLEEQVATRAIICLQEVSLAWAGPLHAFFASHHFHFVLASYGSYFNGYMGVGLAFPNSTYEALDIKIERLTDIHRWPQRPRPTGVVKAIVDLQTRITGVWNALFADLDNAKKSTRRSSRPSDVWHQSRDRRNMIVFAKLRNKANGARLCVGTYHMPCAFYSPPTMLIHSALAVSRFQECCAGDPGVFAGDFNIKPNDSCYDMITTGSIDNKHKDFPAPGPDGSPATNWMPVLRHPMKSAYKEVLGQEPDFTNYAQVNDDQPFVDTLDYIFCSEDVDVVDVVRLPDRNGVNGPYPVRSEPSDHAMIGATLRLPAASAKFSRKSSAATADATTASRK